MATIKFNRGNAAGIPVLEDGEPGFTLDTHKLYIGEGGVNYQIGAGTVTSVDITAPAAGITASGGPITGAGSITLALADDLAALEGLSGTNDIYYRSGANTWTSVTIGSGISFSGGTLSATGSGGTVTSVALAVPSIMSVSGSPVTSSGTLTVSLATQSANKFFAGPTSGGAASPTFRDQVVADLPSLTNLTAANSAFADEIASYSSVGASNRKLVLRDMLGRNMPTPGGRLTLTSGTPVTTSDVTGATTLYYTPYIHDRICLWNSTEARYEVYDFGEISLSIGTVTAGLPYDIFAYISSGSVAIEKLAWSSATARATAVVYSSGRLIKSGDTSRLLLGTICPYSTTQLKVTSDSCGVSNVYNRVRRTMYAVDTTNSWSYTTATWREANASSTVGVSRVEYVETYSIDHARAVVANLPYNSLVASGVSGGVGLSSSTTNSAQIMGGSALINMATYCESIWDGYLPIGYGTVRRLEIAAASGTANWYGDAGLSYFQTGMVVEFFH